MAYRLLPYGRGRSHQGVDGPLGVGCRNARRVCDQVLKDLLVVLRRLPWLAGVGLDDAQLIPIGHNDQRRGGVQNAGIRKTLCVVVGGE